MKLWRVFGALVSSAELFWPVAAHCGLGQQECGGPLLHVEEVFLNRA